jgi:hypothetical protein
VGTEPEARVGSMVRETPAILAAEIMESGGLSWGNANFTSIFQPLRSKPKIRNLPTEDKFCEHRYLFICTHNTDAFAP